MATVYVAEQDAEPREVALKIMNQELTNDRTFVRRFEREAKASSRVKHPCSPNYANNIAHYLHAHTSHVDEVVKHQGFATKSMNRISAVMEMITDPQEGRTEAEWSLDAIIHYFHSKDLKAITKSKLIMMKRNPPSNEICKFILGNGTHHVQVAGHFKNVRANDEILKALVGWPKYYAYEASKIPAFTDRIRTSNSLNEAWKLTAEDLKIMYNEESLVDMAIYKYCSKHKNDKHK